MANDYLAYLHDVNELKHHRTKGALNLKPIKGKRLADGTYDYEQTDGGDYGKNVAIPGVKYTAKTPYGTVSIRNFRNKDGSYDTDENTKVTEQFLEKKIQDVNNHASNSTDSKIAAAQARGQARQQQASRAAKERLLERGNNGGGIKRDFPDADYWMEKNYYAPYRNDAKAKLKEQQLQWRERQNQTVGAKIKNTYNSAKEKTLGAIDSIKRKLAKKR